MAAGTIISGIKNVAKPAATAAVTTPVPINKFLAKCESGCCCGC